MVSYLLFKVGHLLGIIKMLVYLPQVAGIIIQRIIINGKLTTAILPLVIIIINGDQRINGLTIKKISQRVVDWIIIHRQIIKMG